MTNEYKIKGDDYMKTMIINGAMYIDGKDVLFDDLEITEYEEDIEFDIDECDIEDYIGDCDGCEFCDCDCDCEDEEYDANQFLAELIDDYTEILLELGDCPGCIQDTLIEFLKEVLY